MPRAPGVPIRSAQTHERGHQVDAAGIGHGGGQRFGFGRGLDQAQLVAQPLHRRSRHEHAAFNGELRRPLVDAARVPSRRFRDTGRWPPVCISAKHPVPYVFLESPARKQAWPASAAC
jgi:hypothetical protein